MSQSAQYAILTLFIISVLVGGVLCWHKCAQDTVSKLRRDAELRKRPLAKLELIRRRVLRKLERENSDE